MKVLKSICLGSVLVLAGESRLLSAPARTDINPAMQYYQAFLVAPDLSQEETDDLLVKQWYAQKLPPRVGELLERYEGQLKLVRQAAHSTVPCDWGIDMSPGPATLLPHLARGKRVLQAARLHAKWALQEGRAGEAREDLFAAMAMARNLCRDGTLISALVQVAGENMIWTAVAENFGQFSPESLQEVIKQFDAAPTRCTMASCVTTEKAFFHDWMLKSILPLQKENPNDDSKVMAAMRDLFASLEGDEGGKPNQAATRWEQLMKASGGTSSGVLKLLNDMAPYYERLGVMMALPRAEYEAQAKQFAAEVENSPNPLLSLNFPAFDKCRVKEFALMAKAAMVRAALGYKLHGEDGLRKVADPTGDAPFTFQRFAVDGEDRGFQLTSNYSGRGFSETLIFVEKPGSAFQVDGAQAGQPVPR
jgi:hypothetical protein